MRSLFVLGLYIVSLRIPKIDGISGIGIGTMTCEEDGVWSPDQEMISFGLSCPLPLDGKNTTKGRTAECAFRKADLYDGITVQRKEIKTVVCGVFTQNKFKNQCEERFGNCTKDMNNLFKKYRYDNEFRTWYEPYECMEKWLRTTCRNNSAAGGG